MSHSSLIGEIYLNDTLDDIINRISRVDPSLSNEICLRMDGLDELSSEKHSDNVTKERLLILNIAESMEFFCGDDVNWIKKDCSDLTSYYVSGFNNDTHPRNHHIEITKDKNAEKWIISIHHGEVGEDVTTREFVGSSGNAKKEAILIIKGLLREGRLIAV